jgi:transposase-like protein
MSDLSKPQFHDEAAAREWLEARVWAKGRVCPRCGTVDQSTLMQGKSHRPGLYQCNACREPFTVTVGTLYERSHIPLNKWLAATHLMMASKKGMSALQISRMLGISYKSSWFMCHRIRESLRDTKLDTPLVGRIRLSRPTKPISAAKRPISTPASASIAVAARSAKSPSCRWSSATGAFAQCICPK